MFLQVSTSDDCDQYPFPWSIKDKASSDRAEDASHEQDADSSVLESWISEFADEIDGSACPPPMS